MLLLLRKILFYVFLITYIVITPYVLLSAFGYTYHPSGKSLVKTGLISIVSLPGGATVHVQGKKYSFRTPAVISGLLPGRYHVRLSKKEFEFWEKEIEIYPEKATPLDPVILLPVRPERKIVSRRSYEGLAPHIMDFKVVAWENDRLDSVWKIDLLFEKETPIGRSVLPGKWKIEECLSYPNSPVAVLKTKGPDGKNGFWYLEPGADKKELVNLQDYLEGNPKNFEWDPRRPDQLYYLSSGNLYRIDQHKGLLEPDLAAGVLGFGVQDNHLVILNQDYSLVETDSRGRNPEALMESPDTIGKAIFSTVDAKEYSIRVLARDLFVFTSNNGALISNRLPYRFIDKGVRGVAYSSRGEGDRLLYWTEHEIGMISFDRYPKSLFESGPEKTVLYHHGENIRQAFWVFDDSHVIFLDDDKIQLIETKGPAPYHARKLDEVRGGSLVTYSSWDQTLLFLDADTGYLVKRKITD